MHNSSRVSSRSRVTDAARRYRLQISVAAAAAVLYFVHVRRNGLSVGCGNDVQLSKIDDDLQRKAPGSFMTRTREGYRSPHTLCDLPEAAITEMLRKPHNCSRGAERVFLEGEWMKAWPMRTKLRPPPANAEDAVACAVFCVENESPCVSDHCLIPIYMRRNSTDPMVTFKLLDQGEYDFVRPDMGHATVLDGGANCGIASVVFALLFPQATIVSVEPSRSNYDILKRNTRIFPNVIPVHSALWNSVTMLAMTKGKRTPNALEWGFMVHKKEDVPEDQEVIHTMQGVSIPFLLDLFGLDAFDMLKIDIEGSEKEVMQKSDDNDMSWLVHSKMAMFETHDDMRNGSQAAVAQVFWDRTDTWRYSHRHSEYYIYKRHGFDEDLDPPARPLPSAGAGNEKEGGNDSAAKEEDSKEEVVIAQRKPDKEVEGSRKEEKEETSDSLDEDENRR